MKKYYRLKVAGLERDLPLCPLNDDLYIAGFVIFGDMELTEACARALLPKLPPHDIMLTAESKGIPLVQELARIAKEPRYILARKSVKLYMPDPVSVRVKSITTLGTQTLVLDRNDMEHLRDKRVLIVDDVISTGNSLRALEELVHEVGATVAGRAAILAEGDAAARNDLVFLEKLPLFDKNGKPID